MKCVIIWEICIIQQANIFDRSNACIYKILHGEWIRLKYNIDHVVEQWNYINIFFHIPYCNY